MEKTTPAPALPAEPSARTKTSTDVNRGVIAEWTVTIILLLFGTTTLVQAFVIPTGSMEDTLLVGDHVLVDKLAFAPAGAVSKYVLPYSDVKRGDIIVFRYPIDIKQTFVKRAIGVSGDHIKLVNKQLILNGHPVSEPYKVNKSGYIDSYRDNFPGEPNMSLYAPAVQMLRDNQANGEIVVPPNSVFAMGDNRGLLARQPLLGICAAREHHREAAGNLLVVRRADRAAFELVDRRGSSERLGTALLHQDALGADAGLRS